MSLKQFINEQASYYRSMAQLLAMSMIPITERIAKTLGYDEHVKDVYHCTSIEFLDNMKKIQGTKKQISAFTKGLGKLINSVVIKPDLMFVLSGNVVMDFDRDILAILISKVEDGYLLEDTLRQNFYKKL